ncbi:cell shape-determining protein MreC [Desulfuromonas versatilis]|uniref:Cell shape-determining protein MreC n=1 Tax=Desulfuromonas versatilis TaxID=2802975 RepID=A0ABN6DW94_9BACT|nr:rod shape-determining protein MreC [Desulfuromonas versatilis]BCR04367.1 cell shape-determining protein MreC [Desulfuromonas versatilis]
MLLELLRKYRTPLLAGCLILFALLLYSANLRHRDHTTLFEKTILQLTSPFQKGLDLVWKAVSGAWDRYLWLVDTEGQNTRLQEENRQLKAELVALEEVRLANERLRKLLEFRDREQLSALPAQVIAEDAASWFRTVIIDKGTDDGIREGLPVVVAEGAVGRIIRASAHDARVLLITDASSAVASLVQRNRTRGISRGRGDSLTLEFALRQADLEVGDLVISSGTGGVFPKGVPIGTVTRVAREEYGLFQSVSIAPAVDFARLEEVLVLIGEEL